MSRTERYLQLLGIWLAVYPSVLALSYFLDWVELDWPLWAEILISTALTVPLISFVAVPLVKLAIARLEGTTRGELAMREARDMTEEDEDVPATAGQEG